MKNSHYFIIIKFITFSVAEHLFQIMSTYLHRICTLLNKAGIHRFIKMYSGKRHEATSNEVDSSFFYLLIQK